jgi:hypothetical protein
MTRTPPIRRRKFIIALVLFALVFFIWLSYQFDQDARQSERHDYTYSIDLSYSTTIDDVILLIPVPELNNTPVFTDAILNRTTSGAPPDWNLTIVLENGTPMLSIRAARMVPEYHGFPVAIEEGVSQIPTTMQPATEYSNQTPVLMPVHLAVMVPHDQTIDTRTPLGHEPLFVPEGQLSQGTEISPTDSGPGFVRTVPVYIEYTSDRPVSISLRISILGSNSIWRGGWLYNRYEEIVELNPGNQQGWLQGEGRLLTGEGVYY